ncbi:hypothetical protein BC834DRAFT_972606 [Gloeopeniophorella convolvens]|nr:hypothetical protein BC834DRAFT_972606 [Gloeopeniophorella convolvens]
MVNYHNPATILADFNAFIKFLHVIDGIYIWEYFSSLWFEWSFITRKQPYRWTIWVYAGTRFATLLNVVLNLVAFNVTKPINCQLWLHAEFIFAYVAFALASLLMVLRIVAIWNDNKWVIAASLGAWLLNIAFLIRSIVITSASWESSVSTCALDNSQKSRDNTTVTFCTDVFLLIVMLAGLMRQRDHYLGRLLFNQGLIWLFMATISEIPPFVLLFLNLNDPWNLMFQTSSLLSMTIAATRMYRGLSTMRDRQFTVSAPKALNLPSPVPVADRYAPHNTWATELQTVEFTSVPPQDLQVGTKSEDMTLGRGSQVSTTATYQGAEAV